MKCSVTLLIVLVAALAGCSSAPPPASPHPPATSPDSGGPQVITQGEDLLLSGLREISEVRWAPSGAIAAVAANGEILLLNVAERKLTSLSRESGVSSPRFWSDHQLVWDQVRGGKTLLISYDLVDGQERVLHTFEGEVHHFSAPGDRSIIYTQVRSVAMVGELIRYGPVQVAPLGSPVGQTILDQAYLVGRLSSGKVLAVTAEGQRLAAVGPDGVPQWLSQAPVSGVTIAPGGDRVLWLTGPVGAGRLADVLWTWDGKGEANALSLGGAYQAYPLFSPDGRRIAIGLNTGSQASAVAVTDGGAIRRLLDTAAPVRPLLWEGDDVVVLQTESEKLTRVNSAGRESDWRTLYRWGAGTVVTGGGQWMVHLQGAPAGAVISGEPGDFLPAAPGDPYLASRTEGGLRLLNLHW